MHFEILVEDASGATFLRAVMRRILETEGEGHTFRIFPYKGLGHVPKGLNPRSDPSRRILLDQLPRLLSGYGKALRGQEAAVVIVVDQDQRPCEDLKAELLSLWEACDPRPLALFRIAIEEIESWLLGDREAIERAYPAARKRVLDGYVQDSVCGTWEVLADAVHPTGSTGLKREGWVRVGQAKGEWAGRIAPFLDVEHNGSKSFQVFRDGVRRLARGGAR